MNRLLLPMGERICKCCVRRLKLSEYSSNIVRGKLYYMPTCKKCKNLLQLAERQSDPELRKRLNAYRCEYDKRNRDKAQHAENERRRRRKLERFASIIGVNK